MMAMHITCVSCMVQRAREHNNNKKIGVRIKSYNVPLRTNLFIDRTGCLVLCVCTSYEQLGDNNKVVQQIIIILINRKKWCDDVNSIEKKYDYDCIV